MNLVHETLLRLWRRRGCNLHQGVQVRDGALGVGGYRSTGSRAADGRHLVEGFARDLGDREGWLQERNEEVPRQLLRRLTVQEGIEEASKTLVVNVLWTRKGKERDGDLGILILSLETEKEKLFIK